MQYDDVIAAMFNPSPDGAVASPTVGASPARELRDAIEPIAMHSVWSRATNERLAGLGYDFMTGYVTSRASLLGAPTPGVVVSSFAVFEPAMLTSIYQAGRAVGDGATLLAARDEATIASLSAVLDGVSDAEVTSAAAALRRGIEAATGEGRPLFSGLRDQPWPDSAIGELWRAAELFREHRGDSHVAACLAAGLDAVEMNVLTELYVGLPFGSYSASRGWDEAALAAAASRLGARGLLDGHKLTAQGQAFREAVETATDLAQQPIIDAIGADLPALIAATSDWSQCCIDAGAFPPDVFKRAAG